MASKVLDLTTIAHALNELCDSYLTGSEWCGHTDEQQQFLTWYAAHRDEIRQLDSLKALASTKHTELNRFLTDNGFDPMFDPFNGIGVASILDMLIEWIAEGHKTTINRPLPPADATLIGKDIYGRPVYTEPVTQWDRYPGFRLGKDTATVYNAAGFEHPLARLRTKTGHSLWLMKADEPQSGLELNQLCQQALNTHHTPHLQWTVGAAMPMLEMDLDADLSWIAGTTALSPTRGEYFVQKAFQKFKLRANEKGARVKVVTGMVLARAACSADPEPYVFNDPFIGFFTQPGHDTLPLAAFWADTDVWKEPAGTLEEL